MRDHPAIPGRNKCHVNKNITKMNYIINSSHLVYIPNDSVLFKYS